MSDNTNDPYTGLLSVIDEMQLKLIEYSKKPDHNKQYLERQKAIVNDLNTVLTGIQFYSFHPVYTHLQQMIDNTLKNDPSIESFQINMNLKPVTNRISVIDVNLF